MQQPTAPELELLKQLWAKQPKSARELHNEISNTLKWSYSTTRKTLERMGEKGFVDIKNQGNKKIYTSKIGKLQTLANYARDFSSRILELDAPLPIAMFCDSKLINEIEITELEKLLEDSTQKGAKS